MTEQQLRELLVDSGIKLLKENLVQGTWGNTSVRLDKENMLVTPSGMDYETLTASDIATVNLTTLEWSGNLKPTSEKGIHAGCYLMDDKINAVIHTHPVYCSVLAACRLGLPAINEQMKKYVLGDARLAKYGLPSTGKLAKNTIEALKGRKACLMANHGVLTVGETMEEAFEIIRIMETSAKEYLATVFAEKYGEEYSESALIARIMKE